MNTEELSILMAGISSIIISLVYLTKSIKTSSCLGSSCEQQVDTATLTPMDEALQTFPTHVSLV